MANYVDIQNAIVRGYAYALELGDELYDNQHACMDYELASKIECIFWLAESLQHYLDTNQLGKHTDELYVLLLDATDDYTGDIPDLDENAFIPNTTLINGFSRWGYIVGNIEDQADLMAILAKKADIGDGLLTPVTSTVSGNNIIISAVSGIEISWKIGDNIVTVSSPQALPIADASDNHFRKDAIVMTLTGLDVIQGVESTSIAFLPTIPVGEVLLVAIDIYGDQINSGNPNPPVDLSVPSWTVYGSNPFGKYSNGQTVPAASSAFEQYKEAWTDIAPPNYLPPLASLTSTPPNNALEIGQTITVNLTLAFNQRDGGAETARVINKNGIPLSGTTDTITGTSTAITYQGNVSYGQGAVKNNQAGIPDPRGRIEAGSVNSNMITYSFIYPYFYLKSSSPINASQMATAIANGTAIKVVASSAGTITLPYAPNAQYIAVAYPAVNTTKTRWYVTDLSQGAIPGGVFGAETTLGVDSPDGYFTNVNYKIHVTPLLTNTGATNIQLRNS